MTTLEKTLFGIFALAIVGVVAWGVSTSIKPTVFGAPIIPVASPTNTSASCGATTTSMLAAASSRVFFMASNDTSTATSAVYLCFVNSSSGACNTNTGIRLGPNGAYKMDTGNPWRGQISCVATPTTTVDILYSQ